jgi:hypothetical protein
MWTLFPGRQHNWRQAESICNFFALKQFVTWQTNHWEIRWKN